MADTDSGKLQTVDVLHDQVGNPVFQVAEPIDGYCMGGLKGRCGFGFPIKPRLGRLAAV